MSEDPSLYGVQENEIIHFNSYRDVLDQPVEDMMFLVPHRGEVRFSVSVEDVAFYVMIVEVAEEDG